MAPNTGAVEDLVAAAHVFLDKLFWIQTEYEMCTLRVLKKYQSQFKYIHCSIHFLIISLGLFLQFLFYLVVPVQQFIYIFSTILLVFLVLVNMMVLLSFNIIMLLGILLMLMLTIFNLLNNSISNFVGILLLAQLILLIAGTKFSYLSTFALSYL